VNNKVIICNIRTAGETEYEEYVATTYPYSDTSYHIKKTKTEEIS
jgi:hypothetical protein